MDSSLTSLLHLLRILVGQSLIIGETRIFIAFSLTSLHLHLRILVGQSLIKGEPGSLEPSPRNCHAVFQTAKVDLLVAKRKESILLLHPDLGAETITSH